MRRKVALKHQKNQVKNEQSSEECVTTKDDGDKNMLENATISETLGESSGVTATSKRVKKKDIIQNSEDGVLNGSVKNNEEASLASQHGGKKVNKRLESKKNKDSNKVVSESASNGERKENGVEMSIEKEKLKDAEIGENSAKKEEKNVNNVQMKQGKKQMENKKTNKSRPANATEDIKPAEKQIQEIEKYANNDSASGDDDFVNDKKNVVGKHSKKGQTVVDINVTENKNIPKKNLRRNAKNNDIKDTNDNEIAPVNVPSKVVESSKRNKRKNKNESELNNEPVIKHSKSEKESSDETQVTATIVERELKVVLDRCEEFEMANENANLPRDTLVSVKKEKDKAGTKQKRGKDNEGKKGDKKTKPAKGSKQPDTVLDCSEELEMINENANLPHDALVSVKKEKGKTGTKQKRGKDDEGKEGDKKGKPAKGSKQPDTVLDCSEEFEMINENANLPHDTFVSVKNGKGKAGTKRKKGKDDEGKEGDKKTKSAKEPKQPGTSKSSSKKEKIPDVTSMNFSNDSKSSSGNSWNFKISSWNINGIRAWLEKNGISFLHHEKPDVMCLQETKCSDDKLPEEMKKVEGYYAYWLSGDKDGYSGVGLLSKEEPLNVEYGIGISEHDNEGRVITAEYEKFYVVAAYVPNAGRGLVRLDYRMKWDKDFLSYLKKLDEKKPVILCGDLNVAHEEIDLANPKTNKKNAGFTKEEREGFSTLLTEGFIDTFRLLYPDMKGAYTFWTYMMNARAKNVGWRLDYFVISKRFDESLCDNVIRKDVLGSDHCPVTLFLSI